MTKTTRRSIFLSFVILILAVPAETILLQALTTPSEKVAAREWVAGLSAARLDDSADRVQQFPFAYRKEILRMLPVARRAEVWRDHLRAYLDAHPGLDQLAVATIETAIAMATPEMFSSSAPAALRAQAGLVAGQIEALLGRDEALYLMYRLGPADGKFASAEPITHKLANYVRRLAVVMAGEAADCDCNGDFGCGGEEVGCSGGSGCAPDTEWPACGWFWNEDCDGTCRARHEM